MKRMRINIEADPLYVKTTWLGSRRANTLLDKKPAPSKIFFGGAAKESLTEEREDWKPGENSPPAEGAIVAGFCCGKIRAAAVVDLILPVDSAVDSFGLNRRVTRRWRGTPFLRQKPAVSSLIGDCAVARQPDSLPPNRLFSTGHCPHLPPRMSDNWEAGADPLST